MVSFKKKGLHFDFISDFSIFLPKSGCSLKKKRFSLRIVLYTLNKHLQRIETVCAIFEGGLSSDGIQNFKNRFSFVSNSLTTVSVLGFKVLRTGSKLGCSLKKKKGLHFNFTSDFPIFLPKSRCSLKKKKRSSLQLHL